MNKTTMLYIAVNHKDADYFLTELFNKIYKRVPIIQFNKKTFILETDTCVIGTFIINYPQRTKTLRGAADYFLQSNKPFETRISRIVELYNSYLHKNLWLGIDAKEISEEKFIGILLFGDLYADNG